MFIGGLSWQTSPGKSNETKKPNSNYVFTVSIKTTLSTSLAEK